MVGPSTSDEPKGTDMNILAQRLMSPEARAAWQAWQDSTLDIADHLLSCHALPRCDMGAARCPAGVFILGEEEARWDAYDAARNADGQGS